MKRVVCIFLAIMMTISLSACSWVGRTAGKAQAKIERKIGSVEHGYSQGYDTEKKRSEPQQ
jgi:outer membrane lipopolysaccharide assembly protein LptE/RlpB